MRRISKNSLNTLFTYALVIVAFVVVQIMIWTGNISSSLMGQLVPICAYVVMAVSLNLTVGVLGELSLGHAGFMSIGAFSGVVASISLSQVMSFEPVLLVVGIVVGAVVAGLAGALIGIPVLRLNGDYLAIVTLAFGEIIKNIVTCMYVGVDEAGLHFSFLTSAKALNLSENGTVIIDGPIGVAGIPKLSSFVAGVILVLAALFIVINLVHSRAGRAIMALRDNRIAAESVGVPVTKYKMMAFVTSAALAGAAGALFAMNFSTINASKFDFNTSILVLVFVVLGGLGNIWGSVVSAALLTVLPELLRGFNDYRMLVYAIVLIAVMLITNNSRVMVFFNLLKKRLGRKEVKTGEGGAAR